MILSLFRIFTNMFRPRHKLLERIALLEHQLDIAVRRKRKNKRWKITYADRLVWVIASFVCKDWQKSLKLFRPETVVSWHYRFFGWYWRWICRGGGKGQTPDSA